MGRDLRVGVISPYRCHVLGDSRPEQSSSFSDVVALSATAPDPVNDSRCFLPWQWVLWSHHLTPHGGLRYVCNSNPKWCKKATNGLGDVLDVRDRSPEFGVRAILSLVSFAHAPVDEVARVTIFSENPSKILGFGNLVFRFTAVRLNTPAIKLLAHQRATILDEGERG
ncbi:hypothetical protein SprV_0200583100 [Sparganum proliferum]